MREPPRPLNPHRTDQDDDEHAQDSGRDDRLSDEEDCEGAEAEVDRDGGERHEDAPPDAEQTRGDR